MLANASASQPSEQDRRSYFRVNVILPVSIQAETDTTEGEVIENSSTLVVGALALP